MVTETGAGQLRAYLLQVQGPRELLQRVDHLSTADGPRKLVEGPGGDFFVGMKEQSAGGAAPAAPGDTLRPAVLAPRLAKIAQGSIINPVGLDFQIGVAEGFFRDGVWGIVEGAWGLLKLGAQINNYY